MLHRSVDVQLVEILVQLLVQIIAQAAQPLAFGRHVLPAQLGGLAESDDAGHVQRPRTHAALVAAAVDDRRQQHARIAAADVERADALRAVHLVRADRRHVDLQVVDVEGHLADRLHRVGMEKDSFLFRDRANLPDRLEHADLVVGHHDRDENRLVADRRFQLVEADPAVLVHRQIRDAIAFLLEALARVDHRFVLGDARDDVVALLAIHLGGAFNREVVRLCRAAREDDLLRVRADQIGDLLARLIHGLFGRPAERMIAAGGVAEFRREVRQHCLEDARVDRRRRVVVHVNRKLDRHLFFLARLKGSPCVVRRMTSRGSARLSAERYASAEGHKCV